MTDIPDEAIEAAARAMYEHRPKHTDPARWETPWDEVPEGWKQGQRDAARAVLEAAAPIIRADERRKALEKLSARIVEGKQE